MLQMIPKDVQSPLSESGIDDEIKPERSFSAETIKVIGVGGGGCNAVHRMVEMGFDGVEFIAANTDRKSLESLRVPVVVQLGIDTTHGRGAGANPEIGQKAAEEAADDIAQALRGADMVFVTAGMGGGTGTGAAPVVARIAREQQALTVAVVTKPWKFEGKRRMQAAQKGIEELRGFVDAIITIPNDNILGNLDQKMGFREAFLKADEALHQGVRGITDVIIRPGIISVDFADVRAIMKNAGNCLMGVGEARGESRATTAALHAIKNPMLEDTDLAGATGILINVTGGEDLTVEEFQEIVTTVTDAAAEDCNIIPGIAYDESMKDAISVTVIATGFGDASARRENTPLRATAPRTGKSLPNIYTTESPRLNLSESVLEEEDSKDENDEAPRKSADASKPNRLTPDYSVLNDISRIREESEWDKPAWQRQRKQQDNG